MLKPRHPRSLPIDRQISAHAQRMIEEGRQIFASIPAATTHWRRAVPNLWVRDFMETGIVLTVVGCALVAAGSGVLVMDGLSR